MDERRAYIEIAEIDRRVRASGDRWHHVESLIIGVCAAGVLLGRHLRPDLGWRWPVGYVLAASAALAVHWRRRRVHRTPPRWQASVWPATFLLLVAAGIALDTVVAPGFSPAAMVVAAVPMLPGLAALAWTSRR